MNWTIEFLPFLAVPWLIAASGVAAIIAVLLLWRGRRGALLRIASLALIILALANPNLKQEERESLSNIAVVVLDESASQRIAGRPERLQELRGQLASSLAGIPNLEVRWVESSGGTTSSAEETTLFADLNRALADVPAERLAGVMMVTDGQIHDVPADARTLGFDAPVHALITGSPAEFDNRLESVSASRLGLVGSEQTVEIRALTTRKGGNDRAILKVRREAQSEEQISVRFGDTVRLPFPFPHAGTLIMEVELAAQ